MIIYSLPHFTCQSLNPFKYQLIKSIKTSLEFIKICLIAEFLLFYVFLRAADYFEKHQQACVLDQVNTVKRVAEDEVLSTQGGLSKPIIFNKSKKASSAEWSLTEPHCLSVTSQSSDPCTSKEKIRVV